MKCAIFHPGFLAAALVASLLLARPVRAAETSAVNPPDQPRTGHMLRALARELELTPDQREALKNVVRRHQPVLRPLVQELKVERGTLHDLIAVDPLNETALTAQADRMAALNRELIIASAHLRADLRKVLTPDQLAKFEGWRAHAAARAQRGRAGFQEWLDVL